MAVTAWFIFGTVMDEWGEKSFGVPTFRNKQYLKYNFQYIFFFQIHLYYTT